MLILVEGPLTGDNPNTPFVNFKSSLVTTMLTHGFTKFLSLGQLQLQDPIFKLSIKNVI